MRTSHLAHLLCGALLCGSAMAAASANAATDPVPLPTAGCSTFSDPTGDGTPFVVDPSLPPGPNDPDLDITGVVIATPPGKIRAYVKVATLGEPEYGIGHAFYVQFTHNSKLISLSGRQDVGQLDDAHRSAQSVPFVQQMAAVTMDAAPIADAHLDVVFDAKSSTVIMTTDREPIEKASKAALADGTVVTKLKAQSTNDQLISNQVADYATAKDDYTFGDNSCFVPPKAKVSLTAPAKAVAGHAIAVTGKLTDEADKPAAGKAVHVTLGNAAADAVTDATGAFTSQLKLNMPARAYEAALSFAGDDSLQAATASTPVVVVVQPTRSTLTAAASGASTTVTLLLVDDTGAPLAGKPVTWSVDGKAARTARTDAKGRSSFATAPKHTVSVAYAGDKTRYAPSQATRKV